MFGSLRRPLPRIGRVPRLLLAGSCVLLALTSALGAKPSTARVPRAVGVVVARRDLPAGRLLVRHDLTLARWPAALRPAGTRGDPALLVGRRLAGPIAAREAVTTQRLVGADLAAGLAAGLVATPVVLDDPHAADLVRAGNRIDLLEAARPPEIADLAHLAAPEVRTVATHSLVLAVLAATADAEAELIVAVDRTTAVRITRDTSGHVFTAVVVAP